MKKYEGLFIFPVEASPADSLKDLTSWLQKFEASISESTDLGTKRLGYEIKKHREGKLLLAFFEIDPAKMDSFKRELELKDSLLKYMITIAKPKNPNAKYISPVEPEPVETA